MDDNVRLYRLSQSQIRAIEAAILREERVEIVPTKRGPAVFRIKRQEVRSES